jgi:hypothetical protein
MGSYLVITIDQVHRDLEKLQGDSEQREPLGCVLEVEYPLCVFYPMCKGGTYNARLALHCLMPTKFNDALVYPRASRVPHSAGTHPTHGYYDLEQVAIAQYHSSY